MQIFVSLLALFIFINCGDNEASELEFLIGTWKRENKEQFEVWEKNNDLELNGYSYRIKNNQKTITEKLIIK